MNMEYFSDTNRIIKENLILQQGSHDFPINKPIKRHLFPIIKLSEQKTSRPWEKVECSGVALKAQNLLSADGKHTNKYFDDIQFADGIHSFLDYSGKIILSSIMPDKMILGFSAESYAEMINIIRPDFYLTPDGETYFGEYELSALEINRILNDTDSLLASCLDSQPIGLVKGCNIQQIDAHTEHLLDLGVSRFMFHTGDFLCRGSSDVTGRAIAFASTIRKKVPWLGVYGIGAMKSLRSFSFADGYITQSHFVNPFYGRLRNRERIKGDEKITRDVIMNELYHIQQDISALESQSTLSRWLVPDMSINGTERRSQLIDSMNGEMLRGRM